MKRKVTHLYTATGHESRCGEATGLLTTNRDLSDCPPCLAASVPQAEAVPVVHYARKTNGPTSCGRAYDDNDEIASLKAVTCCDCLRAEVDHYAGLAARLRLDVIQPQEPPSREAVTRALDKLERAVIRECAAVLLDECGISSQPIARRDRAIRRKQKAWRRVLRLLGTEGG